MAQTSPSRPVASPPVPVIIGVDVGTTAVKAVAFGVGSPWRHSAVREYPLRQPRPGWQVQDPAAIMAATLDALTEVVAAVAGAPIAGLSLSSAMHGLLALDDGLEPLTDLITWADNRPAEQVRALHAAGHANWLHRRTGTPVHPMTPQSKLMWFASREPSLTARARWWVGLKDYVLLRLTGRLVTELSSASATGLLDLRTLHWSAEAMGLSGLSIDRLPPVLPTTAVLPLAPDVARAVGLAPGTPIVVGAADGPLSNLGTGAMEPGVAGLSLGTSGAVRTVVQRPTVDDAGRLFCYALTEEHWVLGGAISNGGSVARWTGAVFDAGRTSDDRTLALAETVPAGSEGLVMVPYLLPERAPLWDPELPGAFLGVRLHHTAAHFVRAAVEGVCLQLAAVVDLLDDLSPVHQIRATGGAFRAALWRETMAAALGRPLYVTDRAEGTARGAAALGLFALGHCATLSGAHAALAGLEDSPTPVTVPHQYSVALAETRVRLPRLIRGYPVVADMMDPPPVDARRAL